jgi:Tfp pilus assembly protein PilV
MTSMTMRHKGRSGFVLVELVASLAVLMMSGFGTIQIYYHGVDYLKYSQEHAMALQALQNELEHLRSQSYSQVTAQKSRPFAMDTPALRRLHRANATVAYRQVDEHLGNLVEVTLRVEWIGRRGYPLETSISTYVARSGSNP